MNIFSQCISNIVSPSLLTIQMIKIPHTWQTIKQTKGIKRHPPKSCSYELDLLLCQGWVREAGGRKSTFFNTIFSKEFLVEAQNGAGWLGAWTALFGPEAAAAAAHPRPGNPNGSNLSEERPQLRRVLAPFYGTSQYVGQCWGMTSNTNIPKKRALWVLSEFSNSSPWVISISEWCLRDIWVISECAAGYIVVHHNVKSSWRSLPRLINEKPKIQRATLDHCC